MVIELLSVRSVNSRAHILLLFCQEHPRTHTDTYIDTHTNLSAHAPRRVACAHTQLNWLNAFTVCGNFWTTDQMHRGRFRVNSHQPSLLARRVQFVCGFVNLQWKPERQRYDFLFTVHLVTSLTDS